MMAPKHESDDVIEVYKAPDVPVARHIMSHNPADVDIFI